MAKKLEDQINRAIIAFTDYPTYSYKELARLMGITPVQVALLRNQAEERGVQLQRREISP